jgi:hypothetical protein
MVAIIEICEDECSDMEKYLQIYGWHFNKCLCDFAISLMYKNNKKIEPLSKEFVDKILDKYNVTLKCNKDYDYIFVANMCKADYYGSSIKDDEHVALYIKDTIDDEDAAEGTTMRRWYATMIANNTSIDWCKFI